MTDPLLTTSTRTRLSDAEAANLAPNTRAAYRRLTQGPCTGSELEEAGAGDRFGARLDDLRKLGLAIPRPKYDKRGGVYVYRMGATVTKLRPETWPGPHKICTRCSWRWDADLPASGCPTCKAGLHWLEEYTDRTTADKRAREIDPAEVARELEFLARQRNGGRIAA